MKNKLECLTFHKKKLIFSEYHPVACMSVQQSKDPRNRYRNLKAKVFFVCVSI